MQLPVTLALASLLLSSTSVFAQSAGDGQSAAPATTSVVLDAAPQFEVGASEWMITGGPAWGVVIFHSERGHRYAFQTVSWGRILTHAIGPGLLRGRFEWAFEVVPLFGQFQPTRTYGFGLTPLDWRWNFEPRGRIAPYLELAGGGLWTNDPVPVRTTTANFTAHAGGGIRYLVRPRQALVASYRFHHISNGNRFDRNPGVNAHVLQFGWAYLRPRK